MRTAIYARISEDDGSAKGVDRQQQDCRAEAGRRGWTIVETFVDNDVSATRSKVRPAYRRMIEAVEAGRIDAVLVWALDRLTRSPRELEDVIDLADRTGLVLANVTGQIDLSDPHGRAWARQMGTFARLEVESMSKRIKRKSDERAQAGTPVGYVPFGFERRDGADREHPVEGPVVRELARRVLAGETLTSLAKDLNTRGVQSRMGKAWSGTTLRQMLRRPSLAGYRVHRGEIIGRTNGDAILTNDDHDRLVALFDDPVRTSASGRGRAPVHLLSGLARCGVCNDGTRMRRLPGWTPKDGSKGTKPAYICKTGNHVRRLQSQVDDFVTELILRRLEDPDAAQLFTAGDPDAAKAARAALAAIEARKASAADAFAEGGIDRMQLTRITERLRQEAEAERAKLRSAMPPAVPVDVVGTGARQAWAGLSIAQRRALVDALLVVTIRPQGVGRSFDSTTVETTWR